MKISLRNDWQRRETKRGEMVKKKIKIKWKFGRKKLIEPEIIFND